MGGSYWLISGVLNYVLVVSFLSHIEGQTLSLESRALNMYIRFMGEEITTKYSHDCLKEEKLVVIIFHCMLKNMKKLIESSLYPKRSTVKGQILFHTVR